ncbi:hypothetical protein G6F65_022906 [Rhizopus arrhizus]|nr:hypothetical protein G6F65_022906 [Rhizopus arrhizus]
MHRLHDFAKPIRSGWVAGGSHNDCAAESAYGVGHAFVVRGHYDEMCRGNFAGAFMDVLDHGLASDVGQRFARQSVGRVA